MKPFGKVGGMLTSDGSGYLKTFQKQQRHVDPETYPAYLSVSVPDISSVFGLNVWKLSQDKNVEASEFV